MLGADCGAVNWQSGVHAFAATRGALGDRRLIGKGGHIRTVPVPEWVKATIDMWSQRLGSTGRLFRCVCRRAKAGRYGFGAGCVARRKAVCESSGASSGAPHDLRRLALNSAMRAGRTGADPILTRICFRQTTERYLGCKQRIRGAVNDNIGIEPQPGSADRSA